MLEEVLLVFQVSGMTGVLRKQFSSPWGGRSLIPDSKRNSEAVPKSPAKDGQPHTLAAVRTPHQSEKQVMLMSSDPLPHC